MSKFAKGDKVKNANTNEVGYVIEVYPPRRGRQLYKIKYDDRENDETSSSLIPDVNLSDPFERCKEGYFSHYTEYLKGNTTFKIHSSNNSTISSLKASKTLFRPYQFKPLLKFLNSDGRRILIADEVGLGKTIEAGHIMLELKARGEFHNVLVICPMSLREKWTTELEDKFGLDFVKIERKEELILELQHHNGNVRAVINYDKIREGSDILKMVEENNIKFSLIVCDESHRLRNSNTMVYHGALKLLRYANSVVFMSATPIMIDLDNLYNQLYLLEPEIYNQPEVFRNNVQLNRPFIKALTELNAGLGFTEIAHELETAEVETYNTINDVETSQRFKIKDYFKDYPIYREIIRELKAGDDTPATRAHIQYNLSEMSPMNAIFSRTRKREVTQDWSQAERNPNTIPVDLTKAERITYDTTVEQYIDDHTTYDEYGREHTGEMGLVTLKRQLASSVWATCSDNDALDKRKDFFADCPDSKFNELLKILKEVFRHGQKKIIVFAIFKKTLKYLSIRLEKCGYKNAVIYGDPNINKFEVLKKFQYDDSIKILLSSEVGSEGLDMQFCNSLVNYDLPWNPMVVEQRIGRIDRFAQESPKVNIYNIIVKDSILEDIYSRLLTRIGIFRESIGDLEAILEADMEQDGKTVTIKEALENMERDFYSDKLTAEEVKKKQKDIDKAIETEKLHLKHIEEGLTNTLTNDSYFRNEINKIVKNNAYVTSNELLQLVRQLIKEKLTTCSISETDDPEVFVFEIPKSSPKVLKNFLEQNAPADYDNKKLFAKYILEIEDERELRMTFNQEKAFKDKRLSFINIYHPIITAAVQYFEKEMDKSDCTFIFQLKKDRLPEQITSGRYMLAVYRIKVSRILFDRKIGNESLYPVLYDMTRHEIVKDHELAESFMGRAQVDGSYTPFEESYRLDSDMLDDLRYDLKDNIDGYVNSYREDLKDRLDNNRRLRYQQTLQYYTTREKSLERSIKEQESMKYYASIINDDDGIRKYEKTIRLLNANLRDLHSRKEKDLERINRDDELKVTEEIKSLNLVIVI